MSILMFYIHPSYMQPMENLPYIFEVPGIWYANSRKMPSNFCVINKKQAFENILFKKYKCFICHDLVCEFFFLVRQWNPINWEEESIKLLVVGHHLNRSNFNQEVLRVLLSRNDITILGENPLIPGAERVNRDELGKAYSSHHIYLSILNYPEAGYNIALLEAIAVGMPVISLANDDMIVIDGYNGLVAKNLSEVLEKIDYLKLNPDIARELGNNAKKYFSKNFSSEKFLEKWANLLKTTIIVG